MSDRIVGSVERDERNNGREQDKYVPRQRGNDKETTEISISLDKDLYARQTSRFSFFDQRNEPAKKSSNDRFRWYFRVFATIESRTIMDIQWNIFSLILCWLPVNAATADPSA